MLCCCKSRIVISYSFLDGWLTRSGRCHKVGDEALYENDDEQKDIDVADSRVKDDHGNGRIGGHAKDSSRDSAGSDERQESCSGSAAEADHQFTDPVLNGGDGSNGTEDMLNGTAIAQIATINSKPNHNEDPKALLWTYLDPSGKVQGKFV